jgi:hypothetical protein
MKPKVADSYRMVAAARVSNHLAMTQRIDSEPVLYKRPIISSQIAGADPYKATNAFDIGGALSLFAPEAVIGDVSVGDAFVGSVGVRRNSSVTTPVANFYQSSTWAISTPSSASISQAISATRSAFSRL